MDANWNPIHTAPMNKWVLVAASGKHSIAIMEDGFMWFNAEGYMVYPTHWMPLPDLPDRPKQKDKPSKNDWLMGKDEELAMPEGK